MNNLHLFFVSKGKAFYKVKRTNPIMEHICESLFCEHELQRSTILTWIVSAEQFKIKRDFADGLVISAGVIIQAIFFAEPFIGGIFAAKNWTFHK